MNSPSKKLIEARIKALMKSKKLTKVKLAEELGIEGEDSNKVQAVNRMLNRMKIEDLENFSEVLDEPLENIMFDNSPKIISGKGVIGDGSYIQDGGDPDLARVLAIKDPEERKMGLQYLMEKQKVQQKD